MPCPKESDRSIKNPLKAGLDVFPKIALKALGVGVDVDVVAVVVDVDVQRRSESQDGANDAKAKPGME